MTDEELVSRFHDMWDGFPGLARLIDSRHNVLASNPIACEKGFAEGAVCAEVGGPELHRACKLSRFFENGQPVTDHVLADRVRGWMPVPGRDDVCVHFAVMIPEEEPAGFREMARKKQALSREECIGLLKTELRGVLSVLGDDGYPYGVPINHFYNEEDGKLYFHGGRRGHKIDAIKKHGKASFCVYDEGFRKEGEWALNIRSVIVFGKVELVEDRGTVYRISRELSRKFTDDEAYIEQEIEKFGPATLMFALAPEHMTGKIVNEA